VSVTKEFGRVVDPCIEVSEVVDLAGDCQRRASVGRVLNLPIWGDRNSGFG